MTAKHRVRCEDARRELGAAPGTAGRSAALREHLARCDRCRAHAHRLGRLELVLREAGQWAPAVDERAFVANVVGRVRRRRLRRRAVRWLPLAAGLLLAVAVAFPVRREETVPPPEGRSRVAVTLSDPAPVSTAGQLAGVSGIVGFVAPEVPRPAEAELAELAALPRPF